MLFSLIFFSILAFIFNPFNRFSSIFLPNSAMLSILTISITIFLPWNNPDFSSVSLYMISSSFKLSSL